MDVTPRWNLPLLFAGQASKEIFHNEALVLVDALLHGAVESADQAIPPDNPADGRCWIVAPGAAGDWAGQDGSIACRTEGGWRFVVPRRGLRLYVADRGYAFFHDGEDWRDDWGRTDGIYVGGERIIGARRPAIPAPVDGAVIDAQARETIDMILAALRAHGLIMS